MTAITEKFAHNVLKALDIGEIQHVEGIRIYRTDIDMYVVNELDSSPLVKAVPALLQAVNSKPTA